MGACYFSSPEAVGGGGGLIRGRGLIGEGGLNRGFTVVV